MPSEIEPILRALFGPDKNAFANDREELRAAFVGARIEKSEKIIRSEEPDPAGGKWTTTAEQFVKTEPYNPPMNVPPPTRCGSSCNARRGIRPTSSRRRRGA